jgi:hypothetical protein
MSVLAIFGAFGLELFGPVLLVSMLFIVLLKKEKEMDDD